MQNDIDLDNIMDVLDSLEAKEKAQEKKQGGKDLVGRVEHFYDKISVAAIKLSAPLALGDIIEIGDEEEAIRQKVESMQIEGKNIAEAKAGDFVGIKLKYKVYPGKDVYKILKPVE
jgi:putative protease